MSDRKRKGFTFGSAPSPEVSAYLRQKGDRPAFRYTEVWGEEHAHAFTVAKAVQADVLVAIRSSLQTAIDEGVPFEKWSRQLKPELQRLGWWGVKEMADPATGEVADRQLGSPRRLRTIYQANTRSARAAGQFERAQRTKAVLPFWLYGLGPSEKHRPEHAAKEGVVLPVDDPFWTAWFPPNGWGCKCWLRQITRAEAMRRGISAPIEAPTRTFRREGDDGQIERVQVPVGIDPGWQTSPGRARSATLMTNMADRLIASGEPAARALMADVWSGSTPAAFAALPGRFMAPAAIAPARVREALGTEALLVGISSDQLRVKLDKHGDGARALRPTSVGSVQQLLDRGELVERAARSATYILDVGGDAGWMKVVVKRDTAGALFISTLHPITADKARRLQAKASDTERK